MMSRSPRSDCEPFPRGESPPPTPGLAEQLLMKDDIGGFHTSYSSVTKEYPQRWRRGYRRSEDELAHKAVAPTRELLSKRTVYQTEWNLLEEQTWNMRDIRQRTLVPPLADREAVVNVDSSQVWTRRARLQVALQVESRMEAWLESLGKGAEGAARRWPSKARLEVVAEEVLGAPSKEWDTSCYWTTPTEHDVPSELDSVYDEDSRSCADA